MDKQLLQTSIFGWWTNIANQQPEFIIFTYMWLILSTSGINHGDKILDSKHAKEC